MTSGVNEMITKDKSVDFGLVSFSDGVVRLRTVARDASIA